MARLVRPGGLLRACRGTPRRPRAALVLLLPDRTLFLGDAQLRLGTLVTGTRPELLYPQALPLELLLHVSLPRWFTAAGAWFARAAVRPAR